MASRFRRGPSSPKTPSPVSARGEPVPREALPGQTWRTGTPRWMQEAAQRAAQQTITSGQAVSHRIPVGRGVRPMYTEAPEMVRDPASRGHQSGPYPESGQHTRRY